MEKEIIKQNLITISNYVDDIAIDKDDRYFLQLLLVNSIDILEQA